MCKATYFIYFSLLQIRESFSCSISTAALDSVLLKLKLGAFRPAVLAQTNLDHLPLTREGCEE